MEWPEVISMGLVAGLAVQAIQWVREWFTARGTRAEIGRAHALRISTQLKAFSIKCNASTDEHSIAEPNPEFGHKDWPEIPEFDYMSLVSDAQAIDSGLLARIADLELQRISENAHLSIGYSTHMTPDDLESAELKRLQFLADECAELANTIRAKYGLPPFPDVLRTLRDD